ncbi:MAG: hypothetical protein PVJ86_02765 [Phycisphaerales bacterium]
MARVKVPVDECPAGPEIDAAVAQALGYEVQWSPQPDGFRAPIYLVGTITWYDDGVDRPHWTIVPNYSLEIAAAWELIERLKDKAFDVSLEIRWDFSCWAACFFGDWTSGYGGDAIYRAEGETAPLTISRAFLKANGMEYVEVLE